ncbi:leucine--tRNA ligase [Halanaeroarchaeum sulfurireducens]|uniref:Leucine--tRNA ligase n=1 Tax=Halanaeroarchaeum sulfurireducens TaxID=1604004 RepID=A0A0N9ML39_9EURY|nr:leucine--tRNA ligase [Halanaeroarchaeum sulfurireducens]ALG82940.1 leucyl-tRNA synthetase [Halanaeroarchaeum sulfurireducens]
MDYEPREIERTWQTRWAERGRYEADPDDGEATFVTVPYPYPSGGMHIGHARTYTVPDVYARYRRLQGDTVLFPIAWHVTGTPIIGAVNRLQEGEPEQLSVLRDTYGVPKDELSDLETPMGFARYFIENHYKANMKALGLSIDWRREFTTNDERYSKFITWQYETLKDRGLLEKGLHPVKYCTNEENPVTTHDLLEGEEAEFQEYSLIKFETEDAVMPMATLRPETVYGVTNAFVRPDGTYVRATVDGEPWIVSQDAVEKLRLQERAVTVEETFAGDRLVGATVTNPVTDDEVVILPADFVDPDNATGVVMSVPAHSPDDWVALEAVKSDTERLREYDIDPETVAAIEPRSIIEVEDYGAYPARDAVEAFDIDGQDDPALEDATQEVYNREFHAGRLKEMYDEYAGSVVEDVRDELKADFESCGDFDSMYEFSEEVVCRCGGDVEVAKQETWFLRYNDEAWEAKTRRVVDEMDAIPENTRDQFYHTIGWLNEWPCIRNYGLGTRLPWDDDFVIEPLSDSTIYMAYYTIAHRIGDVPVEQLTREFFDALFYGEDAVEDPPERALDLREEWDYWYPVDYRCSGNDLISNHLTFYLYHHAELFDEPDWPQGVAIMGMGLLEGEKMSSSKGHVVLPSEAIDEYGADTVRFFLLNSAEPWQDYDWRAEEVQSTQDQLAGFWRRAQEVIDLDAPAERPDLRRIDRWLLSKLQATIRDVTGSLEEFSTRHASQDAFYQLEEHLRWYRKRAELDRPGATWTRQEVLRARLRMLAPVIPFMTNELHEQLDGVPVEDAGWPEPDPELESDRVELEEELVEGLADDVRDIVDVTETDPDRIQVFTAADWKHTVFEEVVETGPDVGAVMGSVMQYDGLRERGDAVNDLVQSLVADVRERSDEERQALRKIDETDVYESAAGFLAREFDATVDVVPEDETDEEKAESAEPFRPAILLS